MERFDVVVIGGGIAGVAAALAARDAGASVLLVRRGPAATALAHGGWIDAPQPPLAAALASAGLDIRNAGNLPHPDGMVVRCAAAAAAHTAARLDDDIDTVVCAIAGLPGFHAASLAALWGNETGRTLGAMTIELPDTPPAGWSPVSLAARIEKDPAWLGSAIRRTATGHGRVILPAVLGLHDHTRAREAVAEAAGSAVAEALGGTPSIPGWRLDHALMNCLATAQVRVLTASVAGSDIVNDRLTRLHVSGDEGVTTIEAGSAVLATGKFLGGGITANAEFEESTLGCDVAFERFTRTIDDPAAALLLTDPVRTGHQVVLTAGVRCDSDGRPLGVSERAFAHNLFAAGSVRAGVETARLGLGAAAQDGWTAGERAAALAGRSAA